MYDVPQRRTEVASSVFCGFASGRDRRDMHRPFLFSKYKVPIPNSRIFDFSLSLSLVWDAQLPYLQTS